MAQASERGNRMTEHPIVWTRAEAMACAYCWAEFPNPEDRPDTPEQYWLRITERSRQECRKIVKDRYLLAVASRQAAPVFPPSNLSEEKFGNYIHDSLDMA